MYSAQSNWWSGNVLLAGGEDYARDVGQMYSGLIGKSLAPVRDAINAAYSRGDRLPKNDAQLKAVLDAKGLDSTKILDPWGMPYRAEFSLSGSNDVLKFKSNGPDKLPGTPDDVESTVIQWQYFRRTGQIIDLAVQEYPKQTGEYIRDYATPHRAMMARGVDTEALVDPWEHRYRFAFDTSGAYFRVSVASAGPDGVFDSPRTPSWDDVPEWTSLVRYFVAESAALERALDEYFAKTKQFPQNEDELKPILAAAKLEGDQLLDPWGRPYHFSFSRRSRYWDTLMIGSTNGRIRT